MDDNIFMQCYDYLNQYHIKYQKELEFKDIDELAKDPENNIDKITKSILSLYRDSYIRNLEIKSEVEENGIIKGESNNLIDDKDMTSEEEEVLEITEKTEKINLSDEKEIEPYDPGCEEDLAQNLSKKKRPYNAVKNEIMKKLLNFDSHTVKSKKFKKSKKYN